jgi:hypothetical protein
MLVLPFSLLLRVIWMGSVVGQAGQRLLHGDTFLRIP